MNVTHLDYGLLRYLNPDTAAALAAVPTLQVAFNSSRETHAGQGRVKAARFPQIKTLDDFAVLRP